MSETGKDITKDFLQGMFSDFEAEPKDEIWGKIQQAIGAAPEFSFWRTAKSWIAPVAALIFMGMTTFVTHQPDKLTAEVAGIEAVNKNGVSKESASQVQKKSTDNLLTKKQNNIAETKSFNEIKASGFQNKRTIHEAKNTASETQIADNRLMGLKYSPENKIYTKKSRTQVQRKENKGLASFIPENRLSNQTIAVNENKTRFNKTEGVSENITLTSPIKQSHLEFSETKEDLSSAEKTPMAFHQPDQDTIARRNSKTIKSPANSSKDLANLSAKTLSAAKGKTVQQQVINDKKQSEKSRNNLKEENEAGLPEESLIQEVRRVYPLVLLESKAFAMKKSGLILPKVAANSYASVVKPSEKPWFVSISITPLQTYRIVNIRQSPNQKMMIQNVETDRFISSERNGWQADINMVKPISNNWNFRGGVSWLSMHNWAKYQTGTDQIIYKPANTLGNSLGVDILQNVGNTVYESQQLQMIGLKADVQKFFRISGRNRYFVSLGASALLALKDAEPKAFANFSLGLQHILSQKVFLTFEPTTSYSLTGLSDDEHLLSTNAYNVGLRVGVSFSVK